MAPTATYPHIDRARTFLPYCLVFSLIALQSPSRNVPPILIAAMLFSATRGCPPARSTPAHSESAMPHQPLRTHAAMMRVCRPIDVCPRPRPRHTRRPTSDENDSGGRRPRRLHVYTLDDSCLPATSASPHGVVSAIDTRARRRPAFPEQGPSYCNSGMTALVCPSLPFFWCFSTPIYP